MWCVCVMCMCGVFVYVLGGGVGLCMGSLGLCSAYVFM